MALTYKSLPTGSDLLWQIIRKPGSVLANHLSSPVVAIGIERFISRLWREPSWIPRKSLPPCSRQGLPFYIVTSIDCELLPRSFHPCSAVAPERFGFCGTFPRVTPGCC